MSGNPNAVAGAIAQTNTHGDYSRTQYSSFVPTGGDAANPISARNKSGFGALGAVDALTGRPEYGKEQDLYHQKLESGQANSISIITPENNTIPESPFNHYVQHAFSNGSGVSEQKYFSNRKLGRSTNMSNIRNTCIWSPNEAELFTMGLSKVSTTPVGQSEAPIDKNMIEEQLPILVDN